MTAAIRFLLLVTLFWYYIICSTQSSVLFSAFEQDSQKNRAWKLARENLDAVLNLSPVKITAIIEYKKVNAFYFVLCIVVARNMKEREARLYRSRYIGKPKNSISILFSVIHTVLSSSLFLPYWHFPPPTHPPTQHCPTLSPYSFQQMQANQKQKWYCFET